MKHFVRHGIERGRVCNFNQFLKSKNFGDVLEIISEELRIDGNVYDIIEAYMKYKNDRLKIIKKFENSFDDYRKIDEEGIEEYINK